MANRQLEQTFFRDLVLETIVPESSTARLPEALESTRPEPESDEDDGSFLSIRQRDRLFFGEDAPSGWNPASLTHLQMYR